MNVEPWEKGFDCIHLALDNKGFSFSSGMLDKSDLTDHKISSKSFISSMYNVQ